MADIAREMEDFKAANRTFGGSSNQPSLHRGSAPAPPPQPICLSTPSTCKDMDKYSRSYYNCNKSNVTWGDRDSELKRQRRVLKYKSYAVETRLKSSLVNGFRWMKNKYCAIVHGY
ncbi:uncharacterized protein LOC111279125 [Durio zibethinus]|uniref:Uncharacterized protein LOC111279125 n=1 Tax=Durio zibethinus TaxID=66656 RepID=A0A6P5X1W1_DURZI|nr:uncharacterized protein LOC111279125 [Durio zibethinus]